MLWQSKFHKINLKHQTHCIIHQRVGEWISSFLPSFPFLPLRSKKIKETGTRLWISSSLIHSSPVCCFSIHHNWLVCVWLNHPAIVRTLFLLPTPVICFWLALIKIPARLCWFALRHTHTHMLNPYWCCCPNPADLFSFSFFPFSSFPCFPNLCLSLTHQNQKDCNDHSLVSLSFSLFWFCCFTHSRSLYTSERLVTAAFRGPEGQSGLGVINDLTFYRAFMSEADTSWKITWREGGREREWVVVKL